MKRLAVLTITLLLSLAAFGGNAVAFAEESQTRYPDDGEFVKTLAFSDLKDYEIEGDAFYFFGIKENAADGDKFYKYENNALTEAESVSFSPALKDISTDGYYYYYNKDEELAVLDKQSTPEQIVTFGGGYSNLKQFGDKIYAVKDNVLYSIAGADEPAATVFEYFDFSAAQKIPAGDTANLLTQNYELKFATVKEGTYLTEADLTFTDGYLTANEAATIKAEKDTTALILCYTGNAAVIAVGDKCYVTKLAPEDEIPEDEIKSICFKTPAFENATVTGSEIYASPYVHKGTSAIPAAGMAVKILNKIEYEGVLGASFYEVEYEADGQKHTGYVTVGLVIENLFGENNEPTSVPDPAHSEKNNVTTVVLVLIVIILVLVAVAYLTYAGTLSKRKNKKKKNSGNITEE